MTITGTRSITAQASPQLPALFEEHLKPVAAPDATFYLGGAAGIDTLALDWLAEHSRAALVVVVPCTVADQPSDAITSVQRWLQASRLADVVELRAAALGASAYHARNRWMVDHSKSVVAFPHGSNPASGTWYTVMYAADQGKPSLVVPV